MDDTERSSLIRRSFTTIRHNGIDRFILLFMRYISYRFELKARILSVHPILTSVIYMLWCWFYRLLIRLFRCICQDKYTDADPFKIIWVDPNEIERYADRFEERRGWVVDGDWDLKTNRFMNQDIPLSIHQHYVLNIDWEETPLQEKYPSNPEFNEKIAKVESLFETIKQSGYRSQQELLAETDDEYNVWKEVNDAMHPYGNEIGVNIGRNGEFLWCVAGKHRLAISKILDIDEIPVQVFKRHSDWQAIRERCHQNQTVPDEFQNHPDLSDVCTNDCSDGAG